MHRINRYEAGDHTRESDRLVSQPRLSHLSHLVLVGDNKTSDRGGGEGGEDTRDKGGESETGDIGGSLGSKLAENTDLDTERTDVAEPAARVGRDETRSGREVGVVGAGGKCREGVVLVLPSREPGTATLSLSLTVMTFSAMSLATRMMSLPSRLTPIKKATG